MKFIAVESRHWYNKRTGQTASLFGSHPATNTEDSKDWDIVKAGYTVLDTDSGRVGIGRKPWKTAEEAQAFITKWEELNNV